MAHPIYGWQGLLWTTTLLIDNKYYSLLLLLLLSLLLLPLPNTSLSTPYYYQLYIAVCITTIYKASDIVIG